MTIRGAGSENESESLSGGHEQEPLRTFTFGQPARSRLSEIPKTHPENESRNDRQHEPAMEPTGVRGR